MKKAVILILCAGFLGLAGCSTVTYYTPGGVTENAAVKVAEGPSSDGVSAIAKRGGITKIATIDYRTTETHWYWLSLFGYSSLAKIKQELIVSGE